MKTFTKVILAALLMAGLASCGGPIDSTETVAKTSGELRFTCLFGKCGWAPDVLPEGRDVPDGYSPAANEALICTAVNYVTFCQAVVVDKSPSVANLATYSWYGPGNPAIRSVKMGSAANGHICMGTNFTGCGLLHQGVGYFSFGPFYQSISLNP